MKNFDINTLFVIACAFLGFCEGSRCGQNWDDEDFLPGGQEHEVIRQLVWHRDSIQRKFDFTDNGVNTYTWSDDGRVADLLKAHVHAMKQRVETRNPIRRRDPLFRALFDHASDLQLSVEDLTNGVKVTESATSECGIAIVQTHAQVVSGFVKYGPPEIRANHDIPRACSLDNVVQNYTEFPPVLLDYA
uniref:Protein containing duf1791 n=1 Tax=Tetraselmis sp. GSL018 TaxID=582737 RepID=A0A061S9U8_9CHLO